MQIQLPCKRYLKLCKMQVKSCTLFNESPEIYHTSQYTTKALFKLTKSEKIPQGNFQKIQENGIYSA